ncbi:Type-2 ice-structuring protein [Dissostichus eleginoides]|uniref:Type-2 ice-structuring protein n=1 Tax=Dissostichus eleginoides TaxID=100907 RepID=A0AAD9CD68_DISEL|nr:Type-2 ice-structuring protein [Dissostichus eleginoides]
MKTLAVFALVCAMMALVRAAVKSHVVKRSVNCPGGWTLINGRCFYFNPRPMTWAEAEVNVWTWSDGTAFHYKDWCNGEPNNPGRQRCVQINYSVEKCWDNEFCSTELPSICVNRS